MRLRTLGGVSLEGSDFTRPVPLLLLAYLTLRGPMARGEVASTFFPDATDMSDSLSTALRQIERGTPGERLIDRDGDTLTSLLTCDALEQAEAFRLHRFEDVCAHYRGPFLHGLERARYVDPERWSDGLRAWLRDERLEVASRTLHAAVSLARVRHVSGRHDEVARFTELALGVFTAHVDLDEYAADRSRLDPHDLVSLSALLCLTDLEGRRTFLRQAEPYSHLQPWPECEEAVRRVFESEPSIPTLAQRSFVGRAAERAAVAAALETSNGGFVTLLGSGGVGKTSLAQHVGQELFARAAYPDAVHFVALEDVRFANLVPVRIAEALGVHLTPGGDALDQLVAAIGAQRLLVVLDNFEHVLERRDVPEQLAVRCPNLGLLVTSRVRLGSERERAIALDGLPVPEAHHAPDEVASTDAARLFQLVARRRRPTFEIDEDTAPHVGAICRFADGSPLVIGLAAGLVDLLPLPDLAARIQEDMGLLATEEPSLPARQRSLQAVWKYSWDLLPAGDQRSLAALAVFRGGFDWQAAASVAGTSVHQLRRFVDASLLLTDAAQRFSFHGSLQSLVRERWLTADERAKVETRHREHYLTAARSHAEQLDGGDVPAALAFFRAESANLRAAWEGAAAPAELVAFVDALELVQERQGWWDERRALLECAIESLAEAGDDAERARLYNGLADTLLQQGDLERARRALTTAVRLQGTSARDATMATTLSQLGGVHYLRRELDEALERFEQARLIHRELGDTAQEMAELGNVGAVHYLRADYDAAIRIWKRTLTAHRRERDLVHQALTLNNLGAAYQVTGRLDEALLSFEKAESLLERIGDAVGSIAAKVNIGTVHFLRGDFDRSRLANEAAFEQYRNRGDPAGEALVLNNRAMIHERMGRLDEALELLERALELQEHHDDRVHRSATLYNLSTVTLQRGDARRAAALAREALELADETRNPAARAYALTFLADALAALGDHDAAENASTEASDLFAARSDMAGIAEVRLRRAEARAARGDDRAAADGAREALAIAHRHGFEPLAERAQRLLADLE
jgi:predicted ATPase